MLELWPLLFLVPPVFSPDQIAPAFSAAFYVLSCAKIHAMIQRIQSVFLLLTVSAMTVTVFMPLWQKVDVERSEIVTISALELTHIKYADGQPGSDEVLLEKSTVYIALLALASVAVSLFSIFQYRNRLRQIQLGALNSLLIGGALIATLWNSWKAEELLATEQPGAYLFAFYLFLLSLILNSLANRFIRRDERLVRDSDRLR